MHTILDSTVVSCDKGVKITRRVDILCDAEDDLPTTEEITALNYAAGSCALIAATHEIKVLTHKGEWV